jgi:hypothetical protein
MAILPDGTRQEIKVGLETHLKQNYVKYKNVISKKLEVLESGAKATGCLQLIIY